MKLSGNKILITGGASGIGLGLTERFLKLGNRVIICGRRDVLLNEIQKRLPEVITRKYDLSVASEREDLSRWISVEHPDLNVLVNNAGIQQRLSVEDKDFFERAKEEMVINSEAPLHLTSLLLGLESLDTIMNITSGLSFVPLVSVPVYCATKAFMHSFTLSLRHMLKPRKIEVIEIIPPALNTDLGGKGLHDYAPPVEGFIEEVFEQLKEGKNEIASGFSESMIRSGPEDLRRAFERMNQSH